MPLAAQILGHLPSPLLDAAATGYGVALSHRRYGGDFERRVSGFAERDTWSPEQWATWQLAKLTSLVERAAATVPHYAPLRTSLGSIQSLDDIARIPLLSKEALRQAPKNFLSSRASHSLRAITTSGSTGTPVRVFWSRDTERAWYAGMEHRMRRWHGVRWGEPWAQLGGRSFLPFNKTSPPYWVLNRASRQLFLSGFHLHPEALDTMLARLQAHAPRYLVGYPSALHVLATHALSRPQRLSVAAVFTNAEPLLDHQRQSIAAAFGAAPRENYGPSELTICAYACEQDALHLCPEFGIVEVLDEAGNALRKGETGRLVTTGLLNTDQPLLRYEIGDRGTLSPDPCACGRKLPVLQSVEGRLDDLVHGHDGRVLGRLDHVFKGDLRIREAQVVELAPRDFEVRIVAAPGFGASDRESLTERLRAFVGPCSVSVVVVPALARESTGKLKSVVSLVRR